MLMGVFHDSEYNQIVIRDNSHSINVDLLVYEPYVVLYMYVVYNIPLSDK